VLLVIRKNHEGLFWSKHDSGNVFHWVSWDEICRSKEDDGLGIRPLRAMNEVLKTKCRGYGGLLLKMRLGRKK